VERELSKRTDASGAGSPRLGSVGSGALTALSILFVSGIAAVVGVVIAREFGRSEETDGLLAAYGVFVVIAIASQAIRLVVLPQLARARQEERLAGEIAGLALALLVVAVPVLIVSLVASGGIAALLTGDSEVARDTAADSLRWFVPAGLAHLFAALAASGLAALDDYATAAFGYAAGAVAGLGAILVRVEPDGIVAVPRGMALNGLIALLVPATALAVRAVRERMPREAVKPTGPPLHLRLGTFAVGAALPLSLQLLYVVCLAFAGREGTGAATSFVYAYLAAAALVTVTAGSLGLVTSVPLTRSGLDPARVSRHIVSTAWLALTCVGVAAGAFAIAGGDLVETVLGGAYGGDVGAEVGRLVAVLSPWIIVSIGVAVTFPLTFVAERTRGLLWVAGGALALQVPLAWAGAALLDLDGLALALGLTTFCVLTALLAELGAVLVTLRGLALATIAVVALTVLAFAPPALLLGSAAAALLGILLYAVLVALVRPRGLVGSWRYLRALG
jgi:hypothetical protein